MFSIPVVLISATSADFERENKIDYFCSSRLLCVLRDVLDKDNK
jgi:hypothetical protein